MDTLHARQIQGCYMLIASSKGFCAHNKLTIDVAICPSSVIGIRKICDHAWWVSPCVRQYYAFSSLFLDILLHCAGCMSPSSEFDGLSRYKHERSVRQSVSTDGDDGRRTQVMETAQLIFLGGMFWTHDGWRITDTWRRYINLRDYQSPGGGGW